MSFRSDLDPTGPIPWGVQASSAGPADVNQPQRTAWQAGPAVATAAKLKAGVFLGALGQDRELESHVLSNLC